MLLIAMGVQGDCRNVTGEIELASRTEGPYGCCAIHIITENHHDLRCAACETEPVTSTHSTVLMWGQEVWTGGDMPPKT